MSKKLTTEIVKNRLLKKNIILLSDYNNLHQKITCKCFCGKTFITTPQSILYRANSCGCLMYQYDNGKNSYLWKGIGELSAHKWHSIKNNAKIRKKEFNITIEDAWEQFIKQNKTCRYINKTLIFNNNHRDRSITTASLDRIDPNKGYTKDNIQWIHKDINSMKWDLSHNDFIYWCNLIVNPIKNNYINDSIIINNKNYNFQGYGNISKSYWNDIINKAKLRNINFDITIEEAWNKFVEQKGFCNLTRVEISLGYKAFTASLDRIDSNKGYTIDNVQWVHKIINTKIKKHLPEITVKKYAQLILNNV